MIKQTSSLRPSALIILVLLYCRIYPTSLALTCQHGL